MTGSMMTLAAIIRWFFLPVPIACSTIALLLGGCEQRMSDQPKYEALEAAPAFYNKQAARLPPAGTVPRGQPLNVAQPLQVTREYIERGRERYNIYCRPCHGLLGNGEGPVVQRGFPQPPSFHIERLRQAEISHFYNVISEGYGIMYSYADRVAPDDRWRIAFYIQALQKSQHINLKQHPEFREAMNMVDASP